MMQNKGTDIESVSIQRVEPNTFLCIFQRPVPFTQPDPSECSDPIGIAELGSDANSFVTVFHGTGEGVLAIVGIRACAVRPRQKRIDLDSAITVSHSQSEILFGGMQVSLYVVSIRQLTVQCQHLFNIALSGIELSRLNVHSGA